jgi:hypothetical protein
MPAQKGDTNNFLSLREVRKKLGGRSNKELIMLISKCYQSGDEVKRLLTFELSRDEEERPRIIEGLMEELHSSFWSERRGVPLAPDLRKARRVISEVRRLTGDPSTILFFMLEYVHQGARHSSAYGDMDEAYYSSLESMFWRATRLTLKDHTSLDMGEILMKMKDILHECSHFGWGVRENIRDMMEDMKDHLGLQQESIGD